MTALYHKHHLASQLSIVSGGYLPLLLTAMVFLITPATATAGLCVVCREPARNYDCRIELGNSKLARAASKIACISQIAKTFGHSKCALRSNEVVGACLGHPVAVTAKGARLIGDATGGQDIGVDRDATSRPRQQNPVTGKHGAGSPGRTPTAKRQTPPHDENHGEPPGVLPAGTRAPGEPEAGFKSNPRDAGASPAKPEDANRTEVTPAPRTATQPDQHGPPKDLDPAPPKTVEELAKRAARDSAKNLEKAGEAMESAAQKTWDCLSSFLTDCLP